MGSIPRKEISPTLLRLIAQDIGLTVQQFLSNR